MKSKYVVPLVTGTGINPALEQLPVGLSFRACQSQAHSGVGTE
jgi:hypothetical protein